MKYTTNPKKLKQMNQHYVEQQLIQQAHPSLTTLSTDEQYIANTLACTTGDMSLFDDLLFSEKAVNTALGAIDKQRTLLCDSHPMIGHLSARRLKQEPLCFNQKPTVISQAKAHHQPRSMVAINHWKAHIDKSIILLGDTPSALFYLLERLQQDFAKPALIIAMPAGFQEAPQAKQLLWQQHQLLGIECIILRGSRGGSVLTATVMNSLLKLYQQQTQQATHTTGSQSQLSPIGHYV
ncbi:MAG TPA: precorrin-8X methylmutase [Thiothrix sp.]|nr:precorrin-8X methylmutase [Thiothrix sp.]